MKIDVSIGEVVDKYTILTLKKLFISDKEKLVNVEKEFNVIKFTLYENNPEVLTDSLTEELYDINKRLWDVENDIRVWENKNYFGGRFIDLARSVYKLNDTRAMIKKKINLKYGSDLIEEKSYNK